MKRGELISSNAVELIIAAAGIVVLFFILVSFYAPSYSEYEKISESYLGLIKEGVDMADGGVVGSFVLLDRMQKDESFYLAYFGSAGKFDYDEMSFVGKRVGENTMCVCYKVKDVTKCESCLSLDSPAVLEGSNKKNWVIEQGVSVFIKKVGENYVFSFK